VSGLPPELQGVNIFAGLAGSSVPNSITVYHDTTGDPPQLTNPATLNSGGAFLIGFNGAGSALCDNCDFLKWGAWAAVLDFQNNSATDTRHVAASGLWIAGDIVNDSVGALPVTGSADYAGRAFGFVVNNLPGNETVQQYFAEGNMSMNWNFATRVGRFDVANFDTNINGGQGFAFGGDISAPGSVVTPTGKLNQFNGGLTNDLRSLTGNVTGSFVNGPGQVAGTTPAGVIGNFAIGSNNYKASGIFGGSPVTQPAAASIR
jgi:hypothetical protein